MTRDRQSTEAYCIPCRRVSKRDRIKLRKRTLYAERKKATEELESIANSTKVSTPSGFERIAESSAVGESRGAFSGGLGLDSDIAFSTPGEAPESVPPPEQDRFLRSINDPFWRNPRRPELVSDPDETEDEAPTNGENLPTNWYSDFAQGSQETSSGAIDLASNSGPRFADSLLAHASRQTSQPGNSADAMLDFVPNQPNVSSTPQVEYQQPAPILTEDIDPYNAGLDTTQNINLPVFQSWNQFLPQFPAYAPPLPPQPTINPALEMELFYQNALNPTGGMQEAENLLRAQGVWPESPDSENES